MDKEYDLLKNASPKHRKTRYDFAVSCVRCEFDASKKLRAYFLSNPISSATSKDLYYTHLMDWDGEFSDYLYWLVERDDKDYNPLYFFGDVYDRWTNPTARE